MRIFVITFAVIAAAAAATVPSEYLPPVADNNLPSQEYLAPAEEQTALSNDGYRYKTVRRLKYRHRRDVNELPSNEYLPPAEKSNESSDDVAVEAVEEVPQESAVLANDGYRYKTVRRLKFRHRRDVSELPSNEYLPPAEKSEEVIAEEAPVEAPQDSAVLAEDGYHYKTVRRLKYRHRRDVNELPSNEYLPPTEKSEEVIAEEAPVEAPQDSAVLAEDGYRYKTVRRLKYRHRRDVNELPSNEYLPPAEKLEKVIAEEALVEAPQDSAVLAKDGYRYKTVRRLKYRHRRDISEVPSNEYLPPTEKSEEVIAEEAPVEAPQDSAVLAEDGYRYKTVRRLKYRHRRDVNELPSNEYLPPAEKSEEVIAEEAPVEAPQDSAVLAEDGYRYKTVRRLKYRHRRDVNELPSNEYLPPTEKLEEVIAEEAPVEAPQDSAVLAEDGYRYKTVRRLKYRHRRDINELPSNEYLPPTEKLEEVIAEEAPVEAPQDSAVLAEDGYRYKTVRRLKYRHRRDVNELPSNEYLPPAEKLEKVIAEEALVEAPQDSAVLAKDGYRYKTVRRLKYRHRRDISEVPSNEYLPPTEKSEEVIAEEAPVEAPQDSAVLAEDGYRYKTVHRLKYRHRRDVNELPSNEYLPPAEKSEEVIAEEAPVEAPQDSAVLAEDGYRYKTVRRLKYRHRRDVNELPSNEYLPPTEKSEEVIAEEAPVEAPQDSAVLAEDGYRYKIVRRLKYRHRRDVNELPSNEYLPPTEKSEEVIAEEAPVEAPQDSAVLAEDGYRYKTVRRLKYRHRRDVNELPSNEYLPPTEKSEEVIAEEAPVEAPQDSAVLAEDGYRYKTVRRLKYRHRRDVNELPSNEYLPPTEKSEEVIAEEASVEAPQDSAVLAEDGYRYKTVRRLKYRHRRDVNELPSNEYLPPVKDLVDQEVAVQNAEETTVLADDGYRYKVVRRLKYRH